MPDNTSRACGTLQPVVYFENRDGHILLPPLEIGSDVNYAKKVYELKYRHLGYEMREAGTLAEVDRLQRRLQEATEREMKGKLVMTDRVKEELRRTTGEKLRERLVSDKTSDYERRFIQAYLQLREDKRSKHRQNFEHRNTFIWAREMDSGSKIEDQIIGYHQAGE